jgi:hypothetical protein
MVSGVGFQVSAMAGCMGEVGSMVSDYPESKKVIKHEIIRQLNFLGLAGFTSRFHLFAKDRAAWAKRRVAIQAPICRTSRQANKSQCIGHSRRSRLLTVIIVKQELKYGIF